MRKTEEKTHEGKLIYITAEWGNKTNSAGGGSQTFLGFGAAEACKSLSHNVLIGPGALAMWRVLPVPIFLVLLIPRYILTLALPLFEVS